ncbi:MAG: tRNA (adenosine(37)-N6)-threonylcarbamoyltransferase complex ATPase subunit type 1 TsaE [Ignavibacterium sp.]
MITEYSLLVNEEEESKNFAVEFSKQIKEGDIIALIGNLGSGKTFFVKKFAENFGIFNVNSPTFAIVNQYENELIKINHFDFYRMKSISEIIDIGFYDYLMDKQAITFIEWADLFPEILPQNRYEILFSLNDDLSRKISIKKINGQSDNN